MDCSRQERYITYCSKSIVTRSRASWEVQVRGTVAAGTRRFEHRVSKISNVDGIRGGYGRYLQTGQLVLDEIYSEHPPILSVVLGRAEL